jgi:hypothetical protein
MGHESGALLPTFVSKLIVCAVRISMANNNYFSHAEYYINEAESMRSASLFHYAFFRQADRAPDVSLA